MYQGIWNYINELFVFCYFNIYWFILNFQWIFYPCIILLTCIDHLENIDLVSYAGISRVDTFHYIISKKSYLFILPPISLSLSSSQWQIKATHSVLKFKFSIESSNFINKLLLFFLLWWWTHFWFLSEKMSAKYPSLNNHSFSCQSFFQVKTICLEKSS